MAQLLKRTCNKQNEEAGSPQGEDQLGGWQDFIHEKCRRLDGAARTHGNVRKDNWHSERPKETRAWGAQKNFNLQKRNNAKDMPTRNINGTEAKPKEKLYWAEF